MSKGIVIYLVFKASPFKASGFGRYYFLLALYIKITFFSQSESVKSRKIHQNDQICYIDRSIPVEIAVWKTGDWNSLFCQHMIR